MNLCLLFRCLCSHLPMSTLCLPGKHIVTCPLYISRSINLYNNDDVYVINKTGRILFKTQRSFSVPTAKEAKSNEEVEPKVLFTHHIYNPHKHLFLNLLTSKQIQMYICMIS